MDPVIQTPRLTLIRLTNTTHGHPHLQWFHENYSDPTATAWSLQGACATLEESRARMETHLSVYDNWFYAVFEKLRGDGPENGSVKGADNGEADGEGEKGKGKEEGMTWEGIRLGMHIGSVSLRLQLDGPTLPPPPPPPPPPPQLPLPPSSHHDLFPTTHTEETTSTTSITATLNQQQPLNLRVIGYALFPVGQNRGFATEANQALLSAYSAYISRLRLASPTTMTTTTTTRERYYVEGAVDEGNPASARVLTKLGFTKVGWKEEDAVWLNGEWRSGVWVYGLEM